MGRNKNNSKDKTKNYIIYMHTCPNGKKYIGYTSKTLKARSGKDGIGYRPNKAFYSDICKYGWDNFSHEIIDTCDSLSKAMDLEIKYIRKFETTDCEKGYNKSIGGYPCNKGLSEEEKRKRRNEVTKRWAKKHPEKRKEYERKSDQRPERKARANELNKTPERRKHRTEYMRKYRELNKEKIKEINRRSNERRRKHANTSRHEAEEEPS